MGDTTFDGGTSGTTPEANHPAAPPEHSETATTRIDPNWPSPLGEPTKTLTAPSAQEPPPVVHDLGPFYSR